MVQYLKEVEISELSAAPKNKQKKTRKQDETSTWGCLNVAVGDAAEQMWDQMSHCSMGRQSDDNATIMSVYNPKDDRRRIYGSRKKNTKRSPQVEKTAQEPDKIDEETGKPVFEAEKIPPQTEVVPKCEDGPKDFLLSLSAFQAMEMNKQNQHNKPSGDITLIEDEDITALARSVINATPTLNNSNNIGYDNNNNGHNNNNGPSHNNGHVNANGFNNNGYDPSNEYNANNGYNNSNGYNNNNRYNNNNGYNTNHGYNTGNGQNSNNGHNSNDQHNIGEGHLRQFNWIPPSLPQFLHGRNTNTRWNPFPNELIPLTNRQFQLHPTSQYCQAINVQPISQNNSTAIAFTSAPPS
ncbi:tellurium resistance protein [Reticulomyxa filosa]|uniref:Tellurium resistance protein n=1 Tax=Reticulomyxa filosa TaxID=46433 RepID=X6N0D7_RETFI|nr:tellurium resistance protein [Reticulomyxa filosa]|eukprot:ETO19204.1 tellurium resistance protein [Reticulomyxa filosa]